MRIAILGAGALGSIIAAHLAKAGEDVVLLARGERAKLLQSQGIAVTGIVDITEQVEVLTDPAALTAADLLINTVKTFDTGAALAPLRGAKIAAVLSVQNGVLKNEQLATIFGREATLGCLADFSGELLADGRALFTRNVGIHVGELPAGVSDRVEQIAGMLENAGIRAVASPSIQTAEWSKFVAWIGLTAVAVLSRQVTHRMLQDPDLARLQVTLVRETASLAAALDVDIEDLGGALVAKSLSMLDVDDAVRLVQSNGVAFEKAGIVTHKMSALQDAERGRRLEVEETLGYVVQRAGELGLAIPAVDACYRLLAGINRGFMQPA